ncbi:MAG: aquaporin [Acidimicrobiales bacterium]
MLARRLVAEGLGSAFLVAGVIGSGIMAERLSPDDVGLQLFENAAATAGVLYIIILMFAPISGAHFNPAVTMVDCLIGGRPWRDFGPYVVAQVIGGCFGAIVANLMFDLAAIDWSTKERSGADLWLAEAVATFGLVLVIFALVRTGRAQLAAGAVAAYIGAAYFFTSSTSFANPMVSVARTLSDTFAGIKPSSAPMFIVMQVIGAVLAAGAAVWLFTDPPES